MRSRAPRFGWCARSRPRPVRVLSGVQPRHHGLDLGGVIAGDGRRHQARHGIALSTLPMTEDTEITGPLAATFHVSSDSEDMDLFLTLRHFDADATRSWRPVSRARRCRWRRDGCAPRTASSIRNCRCLTALSQAHPAAVPEARRDRQGRCGNLADLDDVQEGPPHPARRAAARRCREPVVSALSRRLQHRTNTIYAGGEFESYLLLR